MKKLLICMCVCLTFLCFGSISFASETDTHQYVEDTLTNELTAEEVAEMEDREFYFDPRTTNQYSPNIERIRRSFVRELIEEGIIPAPAKQPVGVSFPNKVTGETQPAVGTGTVIPQKPTGPTQPSAPKF
jgi:hypothetical protein